MDWKAVVGGNVRRLRFKRGLTQEQLAFEADIDLTYEGGIERGKRNPSLLVLVRIAAALGVSPIDLLKSAQTEFPGQLETSGPHQTPLRAKSLPEKDEQDAANEPRGRAGPGDR